MRKQFALWLANKILPKGVQMTDRRREGNDE